MKNLNETEIKNILRNREQKIADIHNKMFSLYQELGDTGEIMTTAAFPSAGITGMPGAKGGHKDLGDVLLRYQHQLCSRNEEIRKIMWELTEEEDSISRVWACFHALTNPYYSILNALYVENQLYQAVETKFDASHKTFEKYRQQGMKQLASFYTSGDDIAGLMRRQRTGSGKQRKKKSREHKKERQYDQICLSSLLIEEGKADQRKGSGESAEKQQMGSRRNDGGLT